MKFKRLAAAVMAATMCGSLFVGCGNAKKDDTATGEEKITATIKVWGCAEDQADENGNGFRQCVTSLIQSILTGI